MSLISAAVTGRPGRCRPSMRRNWMCSCPQQ